MNGWLLVFIVILIASLISFAEFNDRGRRVNQIANTCQIMNIEGMNCLVCDPGYKRIGMSCNWEKN